MDKETMTTYGFILISTILIAFLLAIATPLGKETTADIDKKINTIVDNTGIEAELYDSSNYAVLTVHYKISGQADDVFTYKASTRLNETCSLQIPSKNGYVAKTGIDVYSEDAPTSVVMDSQIKTLTIYYVPQTYTITYNTSGATWDGNYAISYQYGTELQLSENLSLKGYKFVGWFEDNGLGGQRIYSIKSTDYGNKTFYAKFALL